MQSILGLNLSLKVNKVFGATTGAAFKRASQIPDVCSKVNTLPAILFARHSSSAEDDYQFLQHSKVPTLHFQRSLPRLPIPELSKTCQRYLNAIQPLFSTERFNRTKNIVEKFEKEGKALQDELVSLDQRNKNTSYISGPWFDMYLKSRDPLVLNFNPVIVFKNENRSEYSTQVVRSTNLLISSLRFLKSLRAGILEPDVYHLNPEKTDNQRFRNVMRLIPSIVAWYGAYYYKAFPLDMSQFGSLMNSTRIPKKGRDELRSFPTAKHVLIIKNGNFYVFDVFDKNGDILPSNHIHALVEYISKLNDPMPTHPIGYLTTGERDLWAEQRQHLEETGNKELLHLVDSSVFALILDQESKSIDEVDVLRNALYGSAHSRFYDKSFQLIVNPEGMCSSNMEHAWGDGVAMLRYCNDVFSDSVSKPRVHSKSTIPNVDAQRLVCKLDFKLDGKSREAVEVAKVQYEKKISTMLMNGRFFSKLSKDNLKSIKISPDAIAQLAFQVTYSRLNGGRLPVTYEACSTAAFKHGRTETVRPVTMATKQFVEAVNSSKSNVTDLRAMIDQCSKIHGNLTKEAAMGEGFDRHLFALKDLALKKGIKLPDIFQDEVYQEAIYYSMSTSSLAGPSLEGGGFAAVVPDGFGIGYSFFKPWALGLMVSSYTGPTGNVHTPNDFLDSFETAAEDIYNILETKK